MAGRVGAIGDAANNHHDNDHDDQEGRLITNASSPDQNRNEPQLDNDTPLHCGRSISAAAVVVLRQQVSPSN